MMDDELGQGARISLSGMSTGRLGSGGLGEAKSRPGTLEVIYGDVRIEEEWNPERAVVLEGIDLLWFVLRLRQQLRFMSRMSQDEIRFSDPERRFDLLLWKESGLLLVKNLLDKSQPTVRLDFKDFKRGFLDFQKELLENIIRRYPHIKSHPGFEEIVRMFR